MSTSSRDLNQPDALEDFTRRTITLDGATPGVSKTVHVTGSGPAVIVMAEMPGISPHVARFARWVRDAGFTVYMPSLFGDDGAVPDEARSAEVFQHACVSAEFRAFAKGNPDGKASPVTQWLRALARFAHEECGGPGVGAIGMCFTGNFALSMTLEESVLAPVLSQPSLPLDEPGQVESPPGELAAVRERLEKDDLTVLAYRFEGDNFCQAERFARYAEALGDRFDGRVLPDEAANTRDLSPFHQKFVTTPHSVVTVHLVDEEGEPTRRARDEILDFFADRLKV